MNTYYFALGDILKERGITQADARRAYHLEEKGDSYISKGGYSILCNRPKRVSPQMISVICHTHGLIPADLFRIDGERNEKQTSTKRSKHAKHG